MLKWAEDRFKEIRQKRSQLREHFLRSLEIKRSHLERVQSPQEDYRTIVAIPSLSISKEEITNIKGIEHYESRSLWEILAAVSPDMRVIFVTSMKIDERIKLHLVNCHGGGSAILDRVDFIHLGTDKKKFDNSIPLAQKILDRPAVIDEIHEKLAHSPGAAVISTFIAGKLEYELSERLGLPLLGNQPLNVSCGSKSIGREILENAGINIAKGVNHLYSTRAIISAVDSIWLLNKEQKRLLVKLNEGVSGMGNAILKLPKWSESKWKRRLLIYQALTDMTFQVEAMHWRKFARRVRDIGAVVEQFIEGDKKLSPSVQAFVTPGSQVEILATHEQRLGGSDGQVYLGASFPARSEYRLEIQSMAKKVGQLLASQGVLGPYAVDFLIVERDEDNNKSFDIFAIEINLRQGGTTHPLHTTKRMTNSTYDESTGLLVDDVGNSIFYIVDDNIHDQNLIDADLERFLQYLQKHDLLFDQEKGEGAVMHLLGAIKDYGKLGATFIARSEAKAQDLQDQFLAAVQSFIKNSNS